MDIKRWIENNLGRSILSKRKEAFGNFVGQKLDEKIVPEYSDC